MMGLLRPISVSIFALVLGCGGAKKNGAGTTPTKPNAAAPSKPSTLTPAKPKTIDLDPVRVKVIRKGKGEPDVVVYDARSLLDEGAAALVKGKLDLALARFKRLVDDFPKSRLVGPALFNSGLAFEGKGNYDKAIKMYRELLRVRPKGRDAIDAQARLAGVLAELERWRLAKVELEKLLARNDLRHADRVEAMSRLTFVLVEQKSYARAEKLAAEAIRYAAGVRGVAHFESDYYIAMAHYYLAQIPHRQARALPLRMPDAQMKKDIAAKRKLLLMAYDRYVETLRVKHAYWATAAGYQMSQMFKEFWDDMVLAPIPADLGPRKARIYAEEVHKKGLEFLKKALTGHTRNIELAAAFRTSTSWSQASKVRANQIAAILARETAGELVIPKRSKTVPKGGAVPASKYVPGRRNL